MGRAGWITPGSRASEPNQGAAMTTAPIEQRRILATAIPGPRSELLQKRKLSAVSAGVGTGLPIYVERAGGGILVDVDGNHLIDFGSGIAVTTVGLSLIHISEPTRRTPISYAVFCLKKKKQTQKTQDHPH